jgi:hypothetical protein
MRELRWLIVVFMLCLPVVVLVFMPAWWRNDSAIAVPLPVPSGDQEIAWIHTTTNAATWERFVTGVMRTPMTVRGLHVDDTRAFLDSTTAVPELVLSRDGHAGKLRIRWYKLQNEVGHWEWIRALAARSPAPLAVIGGGSTNRALELARAMEEQTTWAGSGGARPPLLVTTATAVFDSDDINKTRLVDIYKGRTFRFCFSNEAMANAVVDFVYSRPELTPAPPTKTPDGVLVVNWLDDQYSIDLQGQFQEALLRARKTTHGAAFEYWKVAFSVGGFVSPNIYEQETAQRIAAHLGQVSDQRLLLVLPSTTHPARRLLQSLVDTDPTAANRLVVVTGDGIPVNAVLRDGEFAWPVGSMPVPLVFFAHNDPTAWDTPESRIQPPLGYEFRPPNGTEEAMHFGTLTKILATECFPTDRPLLTHGNLLTDRLKSLSPAFFEANGERKSGTGEHVVVVRPRPEPTLSIWKREPTGWTAVGSAIDLRHRNREKIRP